MKDNKKVYCIIPALNEESTISKVVKSVKSLVTEVVVVADGSEDDTASKAQAAGALVLKHTINRGQGAALATGNAYALMNGADILVHFDADGQFSADELLEMIRPLENDEADIVFGSRFMGKKSNMPWLKEKMIVPLAHLVNRIFIGKTLSDPQCGFRAMTALTAKKIIIEQDRMAHCSEIIAKSFQNGLRIKEIPVTVTYNSYGQNFGGGLVIIKEMLIGSIINSK